MRWIWFVALTGCAVISQEDVDRRLSELCDVADPPAGCPAPTNPISILELDCYADADGDGFGAGEATAREQACEAGEVENADDCDDTDGAVNPDAVEACDGVDNDCSGGIDEGLSADTWYADTDGDGHGDPNASISSCDGAPTGYVASSDDCDDTDGAAFPGNPELCDGIDNDCAGGVDDGLTVYTYYTDGDTDGYGDTDLATSSCDATAPAGTSEQDGDCDDSEPTVFPGNPEICDTLDNDCDTEADEELPTASWYADSDGDLLGDPANEIITCEAAPSGYVANELDCDDGDASIGAGMELWPDADGDGYGDSQVDAQWSCVELPDFAANADDCDDGSDASHPGAPELCDGQDNDCDTEVDEGLTLTDFWPDNDGDGYGDQLAPAQPACVAPMGTVADNTDCDDTLATVNPGITTDTCNGLDDDCDTAVDENATFLTYYVDADGDGYGDESQLPAQACDGAPEGYAEAAGDCDDADDTVNPGETDDAVVGWDVDCDGTVLCFEDADGDGQGVTTGTTSYDENQGCDVTGFTLTDGDCDDGEPSVYTGATEVVGDSVDQDCDGDLTCFEDWDGDGYGDEGGSTVEVSATSGATCDDLQELASANDEDCDDADAGINPAASGDVIGEGVDRDCDGFLTCFEDLDGDGYGTDVPYGLSAASHSSCVSTGAADVAGDCYDVANPIGASIHPSAQGIIGDSIDQDCSGTVTCYADDDGDGFGSTDTVVRPAVDGFGVCDDATNGSANDATDCDDDQPTAHPGGTEVCDAIDNDCEPTTSEAGLVTLFRNGSPQDTDTSLSAIMSQVTTDGDLVNVCTPANNAPFQVTSSKTGIDFTLRGIGDDPPTLTGATNGSRIFKLTNNTVALDHLVLEGNGDVNLDGACIHLSSSADLTVSNSRLTHCSSLREGGAFYLVNSSLTLDVDVEVFQNRATNGGAIFMENSALSSSSTDFSENFATGTGGAIHLENSDLHLDGSVFFANGVNPLAPNGPTTGKGGAIYGYETELLYATNADFGDNQAEAGGAIFLDTLVDTEPKLVATTFQGNQTATVGGAIALYDSSSTPNPLVLSYVDVESGYAPNGGGGLALSGRAWIRMVGGLADGNEAGQFGHFAYVTSSARLALSNSTVMNHNNGPVPAIYTDSQASESVRVLDGSWIQSNGVGLRLVDDGSLYSDTSTWFNNTTDIVTQNLPVTVPSSWNKFYCEKDGCTQR